MQLDNYQFKTTPYEHQLEVFGLSRDKSYFALLMEQGTGKTKVLLDTAGYLWNTGRINALVVIAPNGVHTNWSINEIPVHLPDYVQRLVAVWSADQTKAKEKELDSLFAPGIHLRILCMNVEALSTKRGAEFLKRFLRATTTMMVIDESTTIKNPSALRTKAILKLGDSAKYKRIATGTPITKSPFDAFSQMSFLSDNILGINSFVAFKSRYAKLLDASSPLIAKIMRGGAKFMPQIVAQDNAGRPQYQNLQELQDKIKLHSYRKLKSECLDLPEKLYSRRYYEMVPKQKQAYKDMVKTMQMVWDEETTTALNKLTMHMRLQQIVSGYFTTDAGEKFTHMFSSPDENPKIKALLELIEETEGSVIIFCRFVEEIKDLYAVLSKIAPAGMYYGDISTADREQAYKDFQDKKIRFFITNKTGCRGLTLTAASTVIFYTNDFDLEVRLQAEDRAHRIGQKNNVTYIDMECIGTTDTHIINNLRSKKNVADSITGDPLKTWI
jgi:SNF2 family DNA or RNA helicase